MRDITLNTYVILRDRCELIMSHTESRRECHTVKESFMVCHLIHGVTSPWLLHCATCELVMSRTESRRKCSVAHSKRVMWNGEAWESNYRSLLPKETYNSEAKGRKHSQGAMWNYEWVMSHSEMWNSERVIIGLFCQIRPITVRPKRPITVSHVTQWNVKQWESHVTHLCDMGWLWLVGSFKW